MKFKRKPATPIEANQFLKRGECPLGVQTEEDGHHYVVTIHNQKCYIEIGDWIAAEPDGVHFYPIKDSVFKNIYEPA